MSNKEVIKRDYKSIEKTIDNYLQKKYSLMDLVSNIELLANATFDEHDTAEFYDYLINSIGNLECEYFMKTDEPTNDEYCNYREELIDLVKNFREGIKTYSFLNSE